MPTILRNNATSIEIDRNVNLKYTVNKGDFDVIITDTGQKDSVAMVYIVLRSAAITANYIMLDWRDICEPLGLTSAEELRDLLLSWNVQQSITGVVTKIDSSAIPVTILALNEKRKMATIYNNSTKSLYLKYGEDASSDSFTVKINADDYLELPAPCYLGLITGFWDDVNGNAMVTEIT
jgi:hypothetical protein